MMTLRYVIVFPPITPRWEANKLCWLQWLSVYSHYTSWGLGGREGLGQEQDGCIMLRAERESWPAWDRLMVVRS